MHQATASFRPGSSPFQTKPVTPAPAGWSGRLAPDELRRPGGMLIAALVQCAEERGLSLNQMAAEMGVSYWDISKLRIGFRRIDRLADDFAAASAEFLELPRQTIAMLGGLLDPAEALERQDLSGDAIIHALHLMQNEPSDVQLATQLNKNRPLQALSVDELAHLQRQYGVNPAVRGALSAELHHRPPSKTELLRRAVEEGFKSEAQASGPSAQAKISEPSPEAKEAKPAPAIMRCVGCQTRLRIPHLSDPGEIRCPTCKADYAVHWQAAVCVIQLQPAAEDEPAPEGDSGPSTPAANVTDDDPWSVLGLARHRPWDEVERARRTLLQHYHPDRLGQVSPLVRKLAENAFKRVGDAYGELKARR